MLNFILLFFKDGNGVACTEPQPVGGHGQVIATPVRNEIASKPALDDTLAKDPKDEQLTKPCGEGPAVPENQDPPKSDSQQMKRKRNMRNKKMKRMDSPKSHTPCKR